MDIECALLSFLSKNFVSTKWPDVRAFELVPISCGKEFRAVAGSEIVFFLTKFYKKKLNRDLNRKKSLVTKFNITIHGFSKKGNYSFGQNIYCN